MTRKELVQRDFESQSYVIGPQFKGGVSGCPYDYGFGPGRFKHDDNEMKFSGCKGYSDDLCTLCWNEEVGESEYEAYVKILRDVFGKEL